MVTIRGVAFFTSGHTDITTVVVETHNGHSLNYRLLNIQYNEISDETGDAIRASRWGNTLPNTIGYAFIKQMGAKVYIEYQE